MYQEIYDFDPKWMTFQPSHAMLMARCMEEENLPKPRSLEYIELNGEFLFEDTKKYLKEVFGCQIANFYGCAESNAIAYECPQGHMHLCEAGVHVEILGDNKQNVAIGDEGDIYITTLCNHAMPFIRYKTGDRGRISKNHQCTCGNESPILELTLGRQNDYVIDRYGEKVHAFVFIRPIEFVNERIGHIINQFQVIQNDIDDFTIRLAVKKPYLNWGEAIKKMYLENLWQTSLQDAKFTFELRTELLPNAESGKLAFFIRKGPKEEANG